MHTLEAVEQLLIETPADLSAAEVAERTGMSRATAQRYLSHLHEVGRVDIRLRYGSAARRARLPVAGPAASRARRAVPIRPRGGEPRSISAVWNRLRVKPGPQAARARSRSAMISSLPQV